MLWKMLTDICESAAMLAMLAQLMLNQDVLPLWNVLGQKKYPQADLNVSIASMKEHLRAQDLLVRSFEPAIILIISLRPVYQLKQHRNRQWLESLLCRWTSLCTFCLIVKPHHQIIQT